MRFFIIFLTIFVLVGCGARHYNDNKIFGKGLNNGVKYDTIKNDAYLIEKIHEYNFDYFEYYLSYADSKMKEILENKKVFSSKKIKEQEHKNKKAYNLDGDATQDYIFNEIVKDYNYNE